MINLKITKYRDFTSEELEAQEAFKRKNNNYNSGFNQYDTLTPNGISQYQLEIMNVEITDKQFDAIRKAVIENF